MVHAGAYLGEIWALGNLDEEIGRGSQRQAATEQLAASDLQHDLSTENKVCAAKRLGHIALPKEATRDCTIGVFLLPPHHVGPATELAEHCRRGNSFCTG